MTNIEIRKIKSITEILIFSLLCISCEPNTPDKVVRHEKIPKEAKWYGGADGGFWIYIVQKKSKNTFFIKVYDEYTGDLEIGDSFTICKYCSFVDLEMANLDTLIKGYDGREIHLALYIENKSCFLKKK